MEEFISKSQELNQIIEELYKITSEADCEEICDKLDCIYLNSDGSLNENFRHEYASISGKIRELNEIQLNGAKIYTLDYLLENINSVYDYACLKEKPYIRSLFKLKDHIGLEAGRIALVEQLRWEINNGQESVKTQLTRINTSASTIEKQVQTSTAMLKELSELENANKDNIIQSKTKLEELNVLSDAIEEKVESVHRDSITILGIFASIVLAFTGGLVFSSSVLENIGNASAYRIIIISIIIGLVLVNSIIGLVLYIGKITQVKKKKTDGIKEFFINNAFWIVINTILLLLIAVTYRAWLTSSEKALLDESNTYQIEMHHKNTEELQFNNTSGNN